MKNGIAHLDPLVLEGRISALECNVASKVSLSDFHTIQEQIAGHTERKADLEYVVFLENEICHLRQRVDALHRLVKDSLLYQPEDLILENII